MLNYRKIHHWHQTNSSELDLVAEEQCFQGDNEEKITRDSEESIVDDNNDRTNIVSEDNVETEKMTEVTKDNDTDVSEGEIDKNKDINSEQNMKLECRRSEVEEFELQLQVL